jgi:hypothetical protein
MRNFLTIAQGVDTAPLLAALARNADLWNQYKIRTTHPGTAHAQADDILVMYNAMTPEHEDADAVLAFVNSLDVEPFPAWYRLPQLRPMIMGLMRQVDGVRLGRVVITRLPPGCCILPHADGGRPAEFYERYQIMLQCEPGTQFLVGDEVMSARMGDVFWFNNLLTHSVANNSAQDRIVVIADVRSA